MENETIFFKESIDEDLLKTAYSKILNIKDTEIQICSVLCEVDEIDFDKALIIQYYLFEFGAFKFELTPLISKTTRINSYKQNYELYRHLMNEVDKDLLIPGDFDDLSESYYVILKKGKKEKEVYIIQPEEYEKQGIEIFKEK